MVLKVVFLKGIVFLLTISFSLSQNIVCERTYLIPDDQKMVSIASSDTGWLAFGQGRNLDEFSEILKIDTSGNLLWRKPLVFSDQTISDSYSFDMVAVPNENYSYYTSGFYFASSGTSDFVVKINAQGDTVWSYIYGVFGIYQSTVKLHALQDKSVLSIGFQQQSGTGEDVLVRRIDSLGQLLWQEIYPMPGNQRAYDVTEMLDGSLIIAGRSDGDNLIMRIGFDGRIVEDTSYSPLNGDFRQIGVRCNPLNKIFVNGGYLDSGNPIGESSRLTNLTLDYQIVFDPFATDFRVNSDSNIVVERVSITPNHTGVSVFSDSTELSTFIFPNPENAIREINSMEFIGGMI